MDNRLKQKLEDFVLWIIEKREESLKTIHQCEEKHNNRKHKLSSSDLFYTYLAPSDERLLEKYKMWHNSLDEDCTDKLRKAFLNIEFDDNCLSLLDENTIEYITKNIDNLNNIEPYLLQLFLNTVNEINYFNGARLSSGSILNDDDNTKYRTEVNRLKKEADNLQYYSKEQISIRLPRLPKDSLLMLFNILGREDISKAAEDFFFSYFYAYENRKNKPRGKDDYLLSLKARFRLSTNQEIQDHLTHMPSFELSYFSKYTS